MTMKKLIQIPTAINNQARNNITRMAYNFTKLSDSVTELNIYDEISNKKSYDWFNEKEGTEVTPNDFKNELKSVSTNEVVVRINSGGGEVTAANVISVAIQEERAKGKKITCKIDGMCASAAVQIALSCEQVVIHQSAYMMIHNPMCFLFGYVNALELQEHIDFLNSIKKGIMNTYISKTGLDEAEISEMMDKTTYMDGIEAVERGFADSLMFDEEEDDEEKVINRISKVAMNSIYDFPKELQSKIDCVKNKEGDIDIMNLNELKQKYPDLVNQIRTEAMNSVDNTNVIQEAVNKERERIKAIDDMAGKVDAEILNKAKFETFETAEKVALDAIRNGNFVNANILSAMQQETVESNKVEGAVNSGVQDSGDTKAAELNEVEKIAENAFKMMGRGV